MFQRSLRAALPSALVCAFSALALMLPGHIALAQESGIEEIIVTARQQAETLQDVPVTIAAMTEADLDRYNITNLVEAAKMVPNMVIQQAGSGNGTIMRLRGIGSSDISAAFDHSIAINIDGIVVNQGRFILNSYMDMGQLEVLKGPQSLYFGKSATAGVVSVTTKDPGKEFEFEFNGGLETEHDGRFMEAVISAPLTDTFGARLAVGVIDNDELVENDNTNSATALANGTRSAFGDESLNTRLTLLWDPAENFTARLKYSYTEYENDGGWMWADTVCPEGTPQQTVTPAPTLPLSFFPNFNDCSIDGSVSRVNLNPALRPGLPNGYDDGQTGLEQETHFLSLKLDWDINDTYRLESITGWVDFDHWELDDYSNGAGVFGGLHNNVYESLSQEFRLSSSFDGPVNFQAGLYYQETEQEFDAYQYAFNIAITPNFLGPAYGLVGGDPAALILGPDPLTGNGYDYNKRHLTDTDLFSGYMALYWDVNERLEITAGARYTDEQKDGSIQIPYIHAAATLLGFNAPPLIDGLEFEDDNISPEFAVNYYVTPDVSVFFAYKEAFKSGGIDHSALPTAALNPAVNGGDFSFLIYDSEVSDGFEFGMKGNFLDGAMRLNATVFTYEYTDLQVQLFDSNTIQFQTFNASALESSGIEFDLLWDTSIPGLTVRSAWAWTDVEYTDDFINATGENLKGSDGAGSADIAGFVGFTYDFGVMPNWRMNVSADARYSDDYAWTVTLDPFVQDSYWFFDASMSLYSEDGRHEFSLIGRNLSDEIYIVGGGNTPGRCPNFDGSGLGPPCNSTGANSLDQVAYTPLGRTLSLRYKFTL